MRAAGFTLLEVLIALVIFAMAAQAVVWVFAEQSAGIARAERMQQATALARNTLNAWGMICHCAMGSRVVTAAMDCAGRCGSRRIRLPPQHRRYRYDCMRLSSPYATSVPTAVCCN